MKNYLKHEPRYDYDKDRSLLCSLDEKRKVSTKIIYTPKHTPKQDKRKEKILKEHKEHKENILKEFEKLSQLPKEEKKNKKSKKRK